MLRLSRNLRPHAHRAAAAAALLLIATLPVRAGGIDVAEWSLSMALFDNQGDVESDRFLVVQNPFVDSHSISLGLNHAETSYDFGWNDAGGTFRLDMTHQAEGTNNSFQSSGSSGGITFAPADTDLLVSVRGEYAYNFPADLMTLDMSIRGFQLNPTELIYLGGGGYSTTFGWPAADVLSIDDTFMVPAGEQLRIQYFVRISASLNSAGALGTGSGFIELNITPIPEPATLATLAAAFLIIRRGSRQGATALWQCKHRQA